MIDSRSPNLEEMVGAFEAVKAEGLKNVRLGNSGNFCSKKRRVRGLVRKSWLGILLKGKTC